MTNKQKGHIEIKNVVQNVVSIYLVRRKAIWREDNSKDVRHVHSKIYSNFIRKSKYKNSRLLTGL